MDSAVTPARTKTPVILKPRKVHLASKTEDTTTMHGGSPTLCHFKRTTARKKLDNILKAEKELLSQLEPEPAGTEPGAQDCHASNNTSGIKVMQDRDDQLSLLQPPYLSSER